MPTYQYACRACGHRFDAVQGFHEEALQRCPACEEGELRKLFGNVGVVFKGSGFYRNDSRAGAKSTPASSGAPSTGGSTGPSDKTPAKQSSGSSSGNSSGSGSTGGGSSGSGSGATSSVPSSASAGSH